MDTARSQIDPLLEQRGASWETSPDAVEQSRALSAPSANEHIALGYNPQLGHNQAYDSELAESRHRNRRNLERRFEHIFAKFERSFEGVGDEIDLQTGDIVVNNGHVKNMRHERDTGSRSLRDRSLSPSGEWTEVGQSVPDSEGDDASDELCSEPPGSQTSWKQRTSLAPHARRTRARANGVTPGSHEASPSQENILNQIPSLRQAILNFQSQYRAGQPAAPDAVHALGMDIAHSLTDFMSRSQPHQEPRAQVGANDSHWSYPELPRQEQGRSVDDNSTLGPLFSPTRLSLWAPIQHAPRRAQPKRRRIAPEASQVGAADESIATIAGRSADSEPRHSSRDHSLKHPGRSCANCDFSGHTTWRLGHKGEHLCDSCGMYYYRRGLSKPLRAPSEDEEPAQPAADNDPVETIARQDLTGPVQLPSHSVHRSPKSAKKWSNLERDALLIKLKEIDGLPWQKIASHFPVRSWYAVQGRYSKILSRPSKKASHEARDLLVMRGYDFEQEADGTYMVGTPKKTDPDEEEDLLLRLRDEDGLSWEEIARRFPQYGLSALQQRYDRIVDDCLDRADEDPFTPDLEPRKKKKESQRERRPYSNEEDDLLIHLREQNGMEWPEIATHFPRRSQGGLQKRYTRDLRPAEKTRGQAVVADLTVLPAEEAERGQGDHVDTALTTTHVDQTTVPVDEPALRQSHNPDATLSTELPVPSRPSAPKAEVITTVRRRGRPPKSAKQAQSGPSASTAPGSSMSLHGRNPSVGRPVEGSTEAREGLEPGPSSTLVFVHEDVSTIAAQRKTDGAAPVRRVPRLAEAERENPVLASSSAVTAVQPEVAAEPARPASPTQTVERKRSQQMLAKRTSAGHDEAGVARPLKRYRARMTNAASPEVPETPQAQPSVSIPEKTSSQATRDAASTMPQFRPTAAAVENSSPASGDAPHDPVSDQADAQLVSEMFVAINDHLPAEPTPFMLATSPPGGAAVTPLRHLPFISPSLSPDASSPPPPPSLRPLPRRSAGATTDRDDAAMEMDDASERAMPDPARRAPDAARRSTKAVSRMRSINGIHTPPMPTSARVADDTHTPRTADTARARHSAQGASSVSDSVSAKGPRSMERQVVGAARGTGQSDRKRGHPPLSKKRSSLLAAEQAFSSPRVGIWKKGDPTPQREVVVDDDSEDEILK